MDNDPISNIDLFIGNSFPACSYSSIFDTYFYTQRIDSLDDI